MLLILLSTQAQVNLVPNPGFDEFDDCPTADANLAGYVRDWYILYNTPDYFNDCSSSYGTPFNGGGYQVPRSGGAYMGAYIYSVNNTINVPMEMFQVKLKEKLKVGKKYCVNFYVNPSNSSGYFIDCFDAYFSTYSALFPIPIIDGSLIPQISNPAGNIITDTVRWTEISESFIAEGGEEYMTLGCFKTLAGIDTTRNNPFLTPDIWNSGTYCLFEDISVFYCDQNSLEDIIVPNIFTPNNDGNNEKFTLSIPSGLLPNVSMVIYNRWGIEVYKSENALIYPWDGKTPYGKLVSSGVYYYILYDEKNTKSGFVQVSY
jgi:gliding motility-associated-like protein